MPPTAELLPSARGQRGWRTDWRAPCPATPQARFAPWTSDDATLIFKTGEVV